VQKIITNSEFLIHWHILFWILSFISEILFNEKMFKIYNFSNINIILFIKYFFREGIMFCADDNGDGEWGWWDELCDVSPWRNWCSLEEWMREWMNDSCMLFPSSSIPKNMSMEEEQIYTSVANHNHTQLSSLSLRLWLFLRLFFSFCVCWFSSQQQQMESEVFFLLMLWNGLWFSSLSRI
jgi:hypothetical protein